MLEGQESTCTCYAIFCAVLPGLASGLHLSFRLVRNTAFDLLLSWLYKKTGVFFPISASDPSLEEHMWSAAIHASSGHPNVTCQVNIGTPLAITLSYLLSVNCTLWLNVFGFP